MVKTMKQSIKFMSAAMALAMCFSAMPAAAFAASTNVNSTADEDITQAQVTEVQEGIENGENAVNVYATIASTYQVQIPKTVIVAADTKTGAYLVKASGNIAGDEVLTVAPPASFDFNSGEKKASVTATITQDVTEWAYADVAGEGMTQNGLISAPDITAGTWKGSFNFNIGLNAAAGEDDSGTVEYTPFTVTMDNREQLGYTHSEGVNLVIPETFEADGINYKVTAIGNSAFTNDFNLPSVEIPASVTSIGEGAFSYCSALTSITYNGTQEQWNAISKGAEWDDYTGEYTVYCTDGNITKS